jgi:hypothetical protein
VRMRGQRRGSVVVVEVRGVGVFDEIGFTECVGIREF